MQRNVLRTLARFRWSGLVFMFFLLGLSGSTQALVGSDQQGTIISPHIQEELQHMQAELKQGGYTFKVGYSPAMEYPIEKLCGLVEPEDWRHRTVIEHSELSVGDLPAWFDWRNLGGNTPVRNQGACGSCWAFATVAPIEILMSSNCGILEDLSEQYLVSCNDNDWGCNGGWFAHDYHQWYFSQKGGEKEAGAVLEKDFPYTGGDMPCNGPHPHPYKLDSWSYVSSEPLPSVSSIKQAIFDHGPVAAAVCVGKYFRAYKSGIFNYGERCGGNVNHAVTLVGWNDDQGPDNGYWILKNSWGEGWGEKGYMRIRYGVSKVGYAANYIVFSNCTKPPEPQKIPDLSGQWVSFRSYLGGRIVTGTFRVSNAGTGDAGSFNVAYYLSPDENPRGYPLRIDTITGLKINQSKDQSIKFTWTTSMSKKFIIVSVDYLDNVVELNEQNNIVSVKIP